MPIGQEGLVFVAAGLFVVFFLLVFFVFVRSATPWLQALMSGVPLSVFAILGMRLRRTDVNRVLRTLIMATQAGAPLTLAEVERAYIQGADLEKITLAYVHAKKENLDVTFGQLVDADLKNRLRELLER